MDPCCLQRDTGNLSWLNRFNLVKAAAAVVLQTVTFPHFNHNNAKHTQSNVLFGESSKIMRTKTILEAYVSKGLLYLKENLVIFHPEPCVSEFWPLRCLDFQKTTLLCRLSLGPFISTMQRRWASRNVKNNVLFPPLSMLKTCFIQFLLCNPAFTRKRKQTTN